MGQVCAKSPSSHPEYGDKVFNRNISNIEIEPEKDEHHNQEKESFIHSKEESLSYSSDEFVEDMTLVNDILQDTEHLLLSSNSDDDDTMCNPIDEYSKSETQIIDEIDNTENIQIIENNQQNHSISDDQKQSESKVNATNGHEPPICIKSKYSLPTKLDQIPSESLISLNDKDMEFAKEINEKYGDLIKKHSLETIYFTERFVIGYRHLKDKNRRIEMFFDIDYFFKMYKNYDMDNIIYTQSTSKELNAWKQFLYGEDRCGHPIVYDLIGCCDTKQILKTFLTDSSSNGKRKSYQKHCLRFMRKLDNYKVTNSKKYSTKIYQHIQIMDMNGFTAAHLKGNNRKITKEVIETLTRMFPESTYKMFIINAPWPFRAIWKTIKKFLDPITVAKTEVLGKDYLKVLVKDVPMEMIPKEYGGSGVWEIQYGNTPKNYPIDCLSGVD